MKKETLISQKIPHESAIKHVSGAAYYTDDIPEPPRTLYGAIGWSKKANAIVKKINLDEVIKSEGVVAVVTAEDIQGEMMWVQCTMEIQYLPKGQNILVHHFLEL